MHVLYGYFSLCITFRWAKKYLSSNLPVTNFWLLHVSYSLQVFSCQLWRCTVAVSCYVNYTPSVRGQPQIWRSGKGEEPVLRVSYRILKWGVIGHPECVAGPRGMPLRKCGGLRWILVGFGVGYFLPLHDTLVLLVLLLVFLLNVEGELQLSVYLANV